MPIFKACSLCKLTVSLLQYSPIASHHNSLSAVMKCWPSSESFSRDCQAGMNTRPAASRTFTQGLSWKVHSNCVRFTGLQVFNARMCQLVLGAGAMQIAGLKSITAKHLALSCQCVGVLVELHPALLAALTAKLPVSHRALLTPEFNLLLQVTCGQIFTD